jgi:hypothetical protein
LIETRRIDIKNKVVKISDIRQLATLFYEVSIDYIESQYKKIPENKRDYSIDFSVKTSGQTEYSSSSLDIFKLGGILDTKRPIELAMTFHDYKKDADISVELADTQLSYSRNTISVEGSDSTWVNGISNRLSDCLDSWENQKTAVKKYKWLIAIPLTWLFIWTIIAIIINLINFFSHKIIISVFSPYLLWVFSIGSFSWFIADYIEKLWPKLRLFQSQSMNRNFKKREEECGSCYLG